jgi:Ca2+-binding EF-hand superfamily protein
VIISPSRIPQDIALTSLRVVKEDLGCPDEKLSKSWIDFDHSKKTPSLDLRNALSRTGMNDEDFDAMFHTMDKDNDGNISYAEFKKVLYARIIYAAIDDDVNGSLDRDEIRESIEIILELTITDTEFESLLDSIENGEPEESKSGGSAVDTSEVDLPKSTKKESNSKPSSMNTLSDSQKKQLENAIKKQKDFDKLWFYQKYLKDN